MSADDDLTDDDAAAGRPAASRRSGRSRRAGPQRWVVSVSVRRRSNVVPFDRSQPTRVEWVDRGFWLGPDRCLGVGAAPLDPDRTAVFESRAAAEAALELVFGERQARGFRPVRVTAELAGVLDAGEVPAELASDDPPPPAGLRGTRGAQRIAADGDLSDAGPSDAELVDGDPSDAGPSDVGSSDVGVASDGPLRPRLRTVDTAAG